MRLWTLQRRVDTDAGVTAIRLYVRSSVRLPAGVSCSEWCRCEGCKNVYGRREGCTLRRGGIVVGASSILILALSLAFLKLRNQNTRRQANRPRIHRPKTMPQVIYLLVEGAQRI